MTASESVVDKFKSQIVNHPKIVSKNSIISVKCKCNKIYDFKIKTLLNVKYNTYYCRECKQKSTKKHQIFEYFKQQIISTKNKKFSIKCSDCSNIFNVHNRHLSSLIKCIKDDKLRCKSCLSSRLWKNDEYRNKILYGLKCIANLDKSYKPIKQSNYKKFYHMNKQKYILKRKRNIEKNNESFLKSQYNSTKKGAKKRSLEFAISIEDIISLYHKQAGLCAISDIKMIHEAKNPASISIDRIDSSKGYTNSNIQLVCQFINLGKKSYDNNCIHNFVNELVMSKTTSKMIGAY